MTATFNLAKQLSPSVALLVLAPVLGELVSGHQTLFGFINPFSSMLTALPDRDPPWLPSWSVIFAFVASLDALALWLIMR